MANDLGVLVVGAGNAALCAALSARESGASVLMIEAAPEDAWGGNSRFAGGGLRFAYKDAEDIRVLVPDLSESEIENTDFGSYTEEQFLDDMGRLTQYRTDPDLAELFVRKSFETLRWMHGNGVRMIPMYGAQAFKVDGKFKFWGGLTLICSGGGAGLVTSLRKTALSRGIQIRYGARATALLHDGARISGVVVRTDAGEERITARATILATGGFASNAEWRTRYLGQGWDLAKVRGTRFNNGDGIRMAIEAGAVPYGHWSGCHAVGWDLNAPAYGDLNVGDSFQKHCYQFGIMINANGKRFVDEGADFRNYTYAKYGRAVLEQPFQLAWQVFDRKAKPLLRDEYHIRQITKVTGNTIEELANKLEGVNKEAFLAELRAYNAAVRQDVPFNPNIKDGRSADGLDVPRSNWANTIDEPPFEAYGTTCGVTFTFGGIKVDTSAKVVKSDGDAIPGLYSAGEMVGGLFYFNYGGGTGLVSGAVFGRTAGSAAASYVMS